MLIANVWSFARFLCHSWATCFTPCIIVSLFHVSHFLSLRYCATFFSHFPALQTVPHFHVSHVLPVHIDYTLYYKAFDDNRWNSTFRYSIVFSNISRLATLSVELVVRWPVAPEIVLRTIYLDDRLRLYDSARSVRRRSVTWPMT